MEGIVNISRSPNSIDSSSISAQNLSGTPPNTSEIKEQVINLQKHIDCANKRMIKVQASFTKTMNQILQDN